VWARGYSSFLAEVLSFDAVSTAGERRPLIPQILYLEEDDILILIDY
jgi:hypothetical protein